MAEISGDRRLYYAPFPQASTGAAGLVEASQRTDGACAGVGGEGVRDAEAQLWVQPYPLPWTGSKRHRDVVQADGLQPEEGGQVVWMLGLKPDDGGTATGTAPPEKRKASPRPPARGQKLPFRTGNLTPRAAPELLKGPLDGLIARQFFKGEGD